MLGLLVCIIQFPQVGQYNCQLAVGWMTQDFIPSRSKRLFLLSRISRVALRHTQPLIPLSCLH